MNVTWRPISLLFKNEPEPDSEYYAASAMTHGHLRVLEAVRAAADDEVAGNQDFLKLYWELGSRIHHEGDRDVDVADALESVGLDPAHATAVDDEIWDPVIRAGMDSGLRLVGDDVGTPIIARTDEDGVRTGYFGPVITEIPRDDDALTMWDALIAMMGTDGFYELKRTRDAGPEFGPRPDPV